MTHLLPKGFQLKNAYRLELCATFTEVYSSPSTPTRVFGNVLNVSVEVGGGLVPGDVV